MNSRIRMYDSLKFFALFIIYCTHFIAYYHEEYFRFWTEFPTSLILNGVSGKLGVAIFGVLLSYFAFEKGSKDGVDHVLSYAVKRYLYFVACGLFINLLYKAVEVFLRGTLTFSDWIQWLKVSVCLGNEIFPTFWCLQGFFVASILAYFVGAYRVDINAKVLILLAFFIGLNIWIPIYLLGILLPDILEKRDKYSGRITQVIMFVAILLLFRGNENQFTYFRDGLTVLLIIAFVNVNQTCQKILNGRITSEIGRISMGIFMLHPITYAYISPLFFRLFGNLKYGINFVLTLFFTFVIIIIIAVPIDWFLKKATDVSANIIIHRFANIGSLRHGNQHQR